MRQILINLLSNAIKFSPEESSITVIANQPEPELLSFQVEDFGIGIPSEDLENVFQEFFQIDKDRDQSFGGTGIGLSLTRRLVRLLGGEISVSSTVGKGSIFRFTIISDAFEKNSSSLNSTSTKNYVPQQLKPYRILVVDDNELIRKMIREILKISNYQMIEGVNGVEGINLAKSEKPDLIFMDLKMPVLNGIEAVKQIREISNLDSIPIVALTGNAGSETKKACLQAGFTDFLAKPFRVQELRFILDKNLRQH